MITYDYYKLPQANSSDGLQDERKWLITMDHGDSSCHLSRATFPFQTALSWLINGDDPNYLQVLVRPLNLHPHIAGLLTLDLRKWLKELLSYRERERSPQQLPTTENGAFFGISDCESTITP